jgi:hypothetical protein
MKGAMTMNTATTYFLVLMMPLFFYFSLSGCSSEPAIIQKQPEIFEVIQEITPVLEEKVIFYDTFDENASGWKINGESNSLFRIEDGYYLFENRHRHDAAFSCLPINIPNNMNFIIESKITKVASNGECSYGITWGADSEKKNAFFLLIFEDYVLYGKRQNGQWETLINWQRSFFINNNPSENKVAIKKSNDRLLVFINEHQLLTIAGEPFFGNNIGFILFGDIIVKADFILITEYTLTPATAQLDPETIKILIQPEHEYLFFPKKENE